MMRYVVIVRAHFCNHYYEALRYYQNSWAGDGKVIWSFVNDLLSGTILASDLFTRQSALLNSQVGYIMYDPYRIKSEIEFSPTPMPEACKGAIIYH